MEERGVGYFSCARGFEACLKFSFPDFFFFFSALPRKPWLTYPSNITKPVSYFQQERGKNATREGERKGEEGVEMLLGGSSECLRNIYSASGKESCTALFFSGSGAAGMWRN